MRRPILLVLTVPALIVGLLMFRSVFYDWYRVPTGSMAPTIPPGTDGIRVLKCAYQIRLPFSSVRLFATASPNRGDIVVFRNPDTGNTGTPFVMRVAAVAGDTIEMRNEELYINGSAVPLELAPGPIEAGEHTLIGKTHTGNTDHQVLIHPERPALRTFAKITVPPAHVFILGDNRDLSRDSRFFGPRPYHDLIGRVVRIPPEA